MRELAHDRWFIWTVVFVVVIGVSVWTYIQVVIIQYDIENIEALSQLLSIASFV